MSVAAIPADPYTPVAAAVAAPGMRLVTTRGVPGPWGEAAKGLMHVKGIPYVRVAQETGQENAELVAWTGINSAPIAIWQDERPRSGWVEIVLLVDRIAPEPPLIPTDERDRATMFGLCHELCSEDGYGWSRRVIFFEAMKHVTAADTGAGLDRTSFDRLLAKYPVGSTAERARQRLIDINTLLSAQLRDQRARGSRYYVGDRLSALDIYAACFAAMIRPLPAPLCPAAPELMASYTERDPAVLAAVDPIMLDHRDFIYETHLELPMWL